MLVAYLSILFQYLQTLTWMNIMVTLVTVLVAWLGYKIIEENLSPLRKIPSPPGRLPLVGHVFTVLKHGGLNVILDKWRNKYGPIITFGPGFALGLANERVVVYGKDLIKQVLVTESHKYNRPAFVKELVPGFGNGLFGSSGKSHARQRKMINPAFSFANIKIFVPAFEKSAQELVKLWCNKIKDSPTVEVTDDICHMTLDIIGETSFGYGFDSVLGKETEVSLAFHSLLGGAEFNYVIRSQAIPFYKHLPLPDNLAIQRSIKLVNNTVSKVINERRMIRQNGATGHRDLLNLLLDVYDEETGKGFDDEELKDQVFTFMLAGHETTSTSLCWTMYELAKHPGIQDMIRTEIKNVFQDNEDLTWAKLEQLEYLSCVIKESLRLHPPAAFVGREANQKVSLGGYEIPKGTVVLVPIEAIHFSSEIWENPLEFHPERFMKNADTGNVQYSFLPFSVGPRICIGNKFALTEMKAILVSLLKTFQISAVPGFEVKSVMRLTTKADPPVKVVLSLLEERS